MMHPKQVISTKRGHTCSTGSDGDNGCPCGPVSKRPASRGEGGREESLADSLFSLVTAAEQQRQAQERSADAYNPSGHQHWNPLSCSAPPALSSRQTVFPPAERLITFTTASREYPHLRPVPLQELASIKLFRAWVRRSFELKDDCHFVLVDRSVEGKNSDEESGLIDSDMKLLRAKDIEIIEVPQEEADRALEKEQEGLLNTTNNTSSLVQNHQELLLYAKSILLFLSEKGNPEARNIVSSCPSSFVSCTPLSSMPTEPHPPFLHSSTGGLVPAPTIAPPVASPTLPRIVAQAPPCLIPGYYIFSPVFDSYGEKRKLPIKIEIPRALVFNGERYKTVSTYIGLGPFGNDPNSFVKLEGDHLVGTVASRLEDDEEGNTSNNNNSNGAMCTYVFKNLRLKTRSLIRTVLDVSYNGMRTGRFFFMVDNEVLPNTSRRFEIKAPSGYTIKMVNKTARSNPVAKHAQSNSPPQSQPSSPQHSLPPSPPSSPHPLSLSQSSLSLSQSSIFPPRPLTPPSALQNQSSFQLQLPPGVLMQMQMQMKQKQTNDATPLSPPPLSSPQQSPRSHNTQLYQQLQAFLPQTKPTKLSVSSPSISTLSSPSSSSSSSPSPSLSSSAALGSSGTLSPPTMPKGYSNAGLAPPHTQLHTQHQQAQSHHLQQQESASNNSNSSNNSLAPFHRPIITTSI